MGLQPLREPATTEAPRCVRCGMAPAMPQENALSVEPLAPRLRQLCGNEGREQKRRRAQIKPPAQTFYLSHPANHERCDRAQGARPVIGESQRPGAQTGRKDLAANNSRPG